MSSLILETPGELEKAIKARNFCSEFCSASGRPKFVFGRNVYAESVAKYVDVTGFIDDFTSDESYIGKPIYRLKDVPQDALILIAVGGRPLTARSRLEEMGFQHIDYFAFYKYSGLPLTEVVFNEGFEKEFRENEAEYEWIYNLLSDEISRTIFRKLVSFRLKHELDLLEGFSYRENEQYFEDLLQLQPHDETFIDIGGYDGFTALEFIKRCPNYRAIHIFEPEPGNYESCVKKLEDFPNIHFYPLGLSSKKEVLRLSPQGSGSKISEQGSTTITVDKLDDVLQEQVSPTLIKMDIEGAESLAIEGAVRTIKTNHPRLAISVYHKAGDFWRIPKQVLSIREDYSIYLRHYTESIYETVVFFIPNAQGMQQVR